MISAILLFLLAFLCIFVEFDIKYSPKILCFASSPTIFEEYFKSNSTNVQKSANNKLNIGLISFESSYQLVDAVNMFINDKNHRLSLNITYFCESLSRERDLYSGGLKQSAVNIVSLDSIISSESQLLLAGSDFDFLIVADHLILNEVWLSSSLHRGVFEKLGKVLNLFSSSQIVSWNNEHGLFKGRQSNQELAFNTTLNTSCIDLYSTSINQLYINTLRESRGINLIAPLESDSKFQNQLLENGISSTRITLSYDQSSLYVSDTIPSFAFSVCQLSQLSLESLPCFQPELGISLKEIESSIVRFSSHEEPLNVFLRGHKSKDFRFVCQTAFESFNEREVRNCYDLAIDQISYLTAADRVAMIHRRNKPVMSNESDLISTSISDHLRGALEAIIDINRLVTGKGNLFKILSIAKRSHFTDIVPVESNMSALILPTNLSTDDSKNSILGNESSDRIQELNGDISRKLLDENQTLDSRFNAPLPNDLFTKNKYLFLNIGGSIRRDGWLNVNTQSNPYGVEGSVDIFRRMDDLEGFPNNSVSAIYCSHTLEHNDFGNGSLQRTLKEWIRVLAPGGLVLISVPDLRAIMTMYLDDSLEYKHKYMAMLMIYGGQYNIYDYHKVGFDEEVLTSFLGQHGFCNIERVGSFNLFRDTSEMVYEGYRISLNMIAKKCITQDLIHKAVKIDHNSEVFDGKRY